MRGNNRVWKGDNQTVEVLHYICEACIEEQECIESGGVDDCVVYTETYDRKKKREDREERKRLKNLKRNTIECMRDVVPEVMIPHITRQIEYRTSTEMIEKQMCFICEKRADDYDDFNFCYNEKCPSMHWDDDLRGRYCDDCTTAHCSGVVSGIPRIQDYCRNCFWTVERDRDRKVEQIQENNKRALLLVESARKYEDEERKRKEKK